MPKTDSPIQDPVPLEVGQPVLGDGPQAGAEAASSTVRLPFNRKERYFTGTVLPMIIASDNFVHLPKFLGLCGLPDVTIDGDGPGAEGPHIEFYTEYSFKESLVTSADLERFPDRPSEADTPDMVLVGPDWLLAVEAKIFHRPTRQALTRQMKRQRVLVDYWMKQFAFEEERVRHVLLLPEKLHASRAGLAQAVVTLEQVIEEYQDTAPTYLLDVLRTAVTRYDDLSSAEPTFGMNADARLSGASIVKEHEGKHPRFGWMGRGGGLTGKRLTADILEGRWRDQLYEVRVKKPPEAHRNWFPVKDFVDRIRSEESHPPGP